MARCRICGQDDVVATTGNRGSDGTHRNRDACLLDSGSADNSLTGTNAVGVLGSSALLSGNLSGLFNYVALLTARVRALEPA